VEVHICLSPPGADQKYPWETVTPRWYHIAMFVFAAVWTGLGIWSFADGDYVSGGFYGALGVAWLLVVFFRDRFSARFEATLERQRARVEGHNAISFPADRPSRSQSD
jgi:hypothetical protein